MIAHRAHIPFFSFLFFLSLIAPFFPVKIATTNAQGGLLLLLFFKESRATLYFIFWKKEKVFILFYFLFFLCTFSASSRSRQKPRAKAINIVTPSGKEFKMETIKIFLTISKKRNLIFRLSILGRKPKPKQKT